MKYKKLRQLIDHHMQLSFPEHPDSDELSEWILDLSEFDAHYLGIANSFLNHKKLELIDFSDFNKMNDRLRSVIVNSDSDKLIFDSCLKYIYSINDIVEEINILLKDNA